MLLAKPQRWLLAQGHLPNSVTLSFGFPSLVHGRQKAKPNVAQEGGPKRKPPARSNTSENRTTLSKWGLTGNTRPHVNLQLEPYSLGGSKNPSHRCCLKWSWVGHMPSYLVAANTVCLKEPTFQAMLQRIPTENIPKNRSSPLEHCPALRHNEEPWANTSWQKKYLEQNQRFHVAKIRDYHTEALKLLVMH